MTFLQVSLVTSVPQFPQLPDVTERGTLGETHLCFPHWHRCQPPRDWPRGGTSHPKEGVQDRCSHDVSHGLGVRRGEGVNCRSGAPISWPPPILVLHERSPSGPQAPAFTTSAQYKLTAWQLFHRSPIPETRLFLIARSVTTNLDRCRGTLGSSPVGRVIYCSVMRCWLDLSSV